MKDNKCIVKNHRALKPLVLAACLLFDACFGVKSALVIHRDGSGAIDMEYRVSKALLELGTQEGNEASPALPLGEKDFEDAANAIDGLKLIRYSTKSDGDDTLYRVNLEFAHFDALVRYMNAQGGAGAYFDYTEKAGKHILNIVLSPDEADYDGGKEMIPVIFEGYTYDFKMSLPSKCDVRFFNGGAQQIETLSLGAVTVEPRSFTFSSPMSDIISMREAAGIEVQW